MDEWEEKKKKIEKIFAILCGKCLLHFKEMKPQNGVSSMQAAEVKE